MAAVAVSVADYLVAVCAGHTGQRETRLVARRIVPLRAEQPLDARELRASEAACYSSRGERPAASRDSMNAACVLALFAMVCLGGPETGGAGDAARGQAPTPAAAPRIPVEVWRGGCCVPTLSLRDALEDAFGQAPAFLHPAPQAGLENLIVYIPDAVRLETSGDRARAVYRVEFRAGSTTGRLLRSSTGSCRDDEMSACAARIVEDAKQAARKLRRSATAAR